MANRILTKEDILEILEDFAVDQINHFKLLSGGSENSNYKIETDKGNFILTICEQKSMQEANRLAELLLHLKAHGFKTSTIVKTKEGLLNSTWKGKPIQLKAYLDGKIYDDFNEALLHFLGQEIAKLHQIPVPEYLPKTLGYGIEHFEKLKAFEKDSPFQAWLSEVKKIIAPYLKQGFRKSIIHSDIFDNNIIVNKEQTQGVIMDFEEAAHYYCLFDIGMAIIGTCTNKKRILLSKVNALLKGYQEISPLSAAEINALPAFIHYAGASMTFWRYQNFRYIEVDPKMHDHYLGLKSFADDALNIKAEDLQI